MAEQQGVTRHVVANDGTPGSATVYRERTTVGEHAVTTRIASLAPGIAPVILRSDAGEVLRWEQMRLAAADYLRTAEQGIGENHRRREARARMKTEVATSPCLWCGNTGWIDNPDQGSGQACPHCEAGSTF